MMSRSVAVSGSDTIDTQLVDEHFHAGRSIIIDLDGTTEQPARRLVNHAADLAFSARGAIHRVERQVFLLSLTADLNNAPPPDSDNLFAESYHR